MTTKKLGRQTVALANPPTLAGHANVVGKKEGEGPLASSFDLIGSDDTFGEATWEKSESAMQKQALALALDKAGQAASTMDWLFAGDLLNQCIGSSFAARGQDIPFFGLYGACSTMGEGLALASMTLDGGFGEWAAVVVSSHFCYGGAAVPHPPGVRRPAHPHRPVDGDRRRGGHPGPGGARSLRHPLHPGQDHRQGDHGHQQHGGRHGPGGL